MTHLWGSGKFYIHVIMAKTIKIDEILRVDVIAYNYVNSEKALNVEVSMYSINSKANIKFYDSEDSKIASNDTRALKTINIPHENARKVSFYIQSSLNSENFEKTMNIRIDATGTTISGEHFEDKKLRKLKTFEK